MTKFSNTWILLDFCQISCQLSNHKVTMDSAHPIWHPIYVISSNGVDNSDLICLPSPMPLNDQTNMQ